MSRSRELFRKSRKVIIDFFLSQRPLLAVLMLVLLPIKLEGFDFKDQLVDISTKTFHHWNIKKKKVTGYTSLTYTTDPETGYLLEISKNLDDKQNVYSEKTLWFDHKTKRLLKYQESDFRTEIKTVNTYLDNQIHTEIWEKGEKKEFKIEITPDLVPFEVLSLFLQSKIKKFQKMESIKFTLYLPVIALELTNKGLPLSLSQLGMEAIVKSVKEKESFFGKKEVLTIRVQPTSFFIKALLPEDKSRFDFSFINQQPFTLIQFEEGGTQTKLIESK